MAGVPAAPYISSDTILTPGARRALAGCFVSGLLLSFTGAMLPAWGHHLTGDYLVVALYFLALNAGVLGSVRFAQWLLLRKGAAFVLSLASGVACGSILFLAAVGPPALYLWRVAGLFGLGAAAGTMQTGIFLAISPMFERDRAGTSNLAGMLFGGGCLAMVLLVSGTYFVYTVPSILIWVSVIPGFFAIMYAKMNYPLRPLPGRVSIVEGLKQTRSPFAVLFALLLFFQFGNEWTIAGWLPLFLVQRLGISPAHSLQMLALYWVMLIAGRLAIQGILPRLNSRKLLGFCALVAVFGAVVLDFTNNRFGAFAGIFMIGGAYAPIYPLAVERIGDRFPEYHPGFFNGIFSFASTGAFLAPASVGLFAEYWGIGVAMALPVAGTMIVLLLVVAIWLEARLSDYRSRRTASP